ncbi:MAG: aminotransferase class IV [Thermaerobacterales bacterium]
MHVWMNHRPPPEAYGRAAAGGWLLPAAAAVAPFTDRGLLLGDGLFETVRVVAGRAPLLNRHQARLRAGAEILGFDGPAAIETLAVALAAVLEISGLSDGYARITCTRGSGGRGYEPPQNADPLLFIQIGPWTPAPAPLRAALAADPVAPHPVLSGIKHTSALSNVLLRSEARARGLDEMIMINTSGCLVEGAATNLFWTAGGRIYTPGRECGCLPGIARNWVLEQFPVVEGKFSPAVLDQADEVFLTNALIGAAGVASVGGAGVWQAPGPVTMDLQRRWTALFAMSGG